MKLWWKLAAVSVMVSSTVLGVSGESQRSDATALGGVVQVVAGGQHSCAALVDGSVKCWGANHLGQLGNASTVDSRVAVAVDGLASGVSSLASSWDHNCVVTGGVARCWGNNADGELGDGTRINRSSPVSVSGLPIAASAVAAGADHSCALLVDRTVWCWGNNSSAELGNGDRLERTVPTRVIGLAAQVESIAAGGNHSCVVLVDRRVQCWGANTDGESSGAGISARSQATLVSGIATATQLALGARHSCALLADGSVRCWGANDRGQLGDATTVLRRTPIAVGGLAGSVSAISAGWLNTCALMTGGAVRCWGTNGQRQVGDGTTTARLTPTAVLTLPGATQLASGATHSCVRTSTGAARCWGDNEFGQLGDGTTTSSVLPVDVQSIPLAAVQDYQAHGPLRLLDTRPGKLTADGQSQGLGIRSVGQTTDVTVAGRLGLPADAVAVELVVGALGASVNGFVTVFPCGSTRPSASTLNIVAGTVVSNAAIVKPGLNGKVCLFTSVAAHLVLDVTGFHPFSADVVPLTPARLLDTRSNGVTVDGQHRNLGQVQGGVAVTLPVTNRGAVSGTAEAVIVNVTAVGPSGNGFVTVWPCDANRPKASTLNVVGGITRANAAIVRVGAGGAICVEPSVAMHLVVDVGGYFPSRTSYRATNPARLLDTRSTGATIDGLFVAGGVRAVNSTTELTVIGRAGIPGNVRSVVLNVTATGATANGFVTAWPCGATRPATANVNVTAGITVATLTVSGVGPAGVCLYTASPTHLVVDVSGYFA